ncbi:RHS repeat-associated core domain-containing protein, partial [Luteimonas aquatica]|uniref:RHS repeat-associated core domain-containing protein n=1 Tax=Luteimonas aquatica TaxID=450364 RepID=UPI001F58E048
YDSMGRKTQQNDPDSGVTRFRYNALGELVQQTDPYGNRIENWYDGRGRVWLKKVWRKYPDATEAVETRSEYVFDTAANGLGQLASESIAGSYTDWRTQPALDVDFGRTYGYDALGRPVSVTTSIDGKSYPLQTQYDALGRAWKALDASGRWAKTEFTVRGFVKSVCNSSATDTVDTCPADANTYVTTLEVDAWGHVVRERRGNSTAMEVSRQYWPQTGRISEICAGGASCNLVKEGYGWDAVGNLTTQQKEDRYLEGYAYDSLNRLSSGTLLMQGGVTVNQRVQYFEYDALGNLCRRENTGWAARDYTYAGRAGCGLGDAKNSAYGGGSTDGAKSAHQVADLVSGGDHLLQYYDARGNTTLRDATNAASDNAIKYTLDDQAYEMTSGSGASTRFWYGSDGARYKRVDGAKTTYYLGNVEVEVVGAATTYKRTVGGVMLQTSSSPSGTAANYYLFHDQLGSLIRIANAAGTVVNSMDFLAYGGRRNTQTQGGNAAPGTVPTLTTRGFTGHEMVDGAGLNIIHMNGRIYDHYVGRFLQPDPVIQEPDNPQSWNAYTYVFNNPL